MDDLIRKVMILASTSRLPESDSTMFIEIELDGTEYLSKEVQIAGAIGETKTVEWLIGLDGPEIDLNLLQPSDIRVSVSHPEETAKDSWLPGAFYLLATTNSNPHYRIVCAIDAWPADMILGLSPEHLRQVNLQDVLESVSHQPAAVKPVPPALHT